MLRTVHILKYTAIAAGLFLLLLAGACSRDYLEPKPVVTESKLLLKMDRQPSPASVPADELVAGMRLFAFQKTGSVPFSHEIYALTRNGNILQALMRSGNWEVVMVSPQGGTIFSPDIAQPMVSRKMYEYIPAVTNGVSSQADEIFYNRIGNLPVLEADGEYSVNTAIARNVAKVKIFFERAAGIDNTATGHTVKLYDVPSSLNWAGGLFPNKDSPALLPAPLEGLFAFSEIAGEPGMSRSNEAVFIIPAHRGADFWLADGVTLNPNPVDTVPGRMKIAVQLTYADGSLFSVSGKEIPIVPRCNSIMEIKLKINKTDVEITTNIQPWERETVNGDLSVPYLNLSTTEVSVTPGNPFRIYFWTNQKTDVRIEPEGRTDDPVTGPLFSVDNYFENLTKGGGEQNFHFDPGTGAGFFDINNTDSISGITRYYLYLNTNGLRRAITINI